MRQYLLDSAPLAAYLNTVVTTDRDFERVPQLKVMLIALRA
jgi:hypothetical protein